MLVKHLTLASFRNYGTLEVAFEPGINLIIGPNGQGKTNMVEAVRYLSALSSHRVSGYLPLIKQGQTAAIVRAKVASAEREILLELELNSQGKNKARVNKAELPRLRELLGIVQTVTFAPEDIDIVRRDPTNRRTFIDELVVQHRPRMAGVYSDYDRVLKQRNALLKSAKITKTTGSALSTLDAWDASLIKHGTEIIVARLNLISALQPHLFDAYQQIAIANNEPKVIYRSSLQAGTDAAALYGEEEDLASALDQLQTELTPDAVAEVFATALQAIRPKELERGITLIGPQRDDLVLMLGALPAKGYASHGECWSYALALRLASVELLKKESTTGDPILILDDVFAELDAGRRKRLAELVAGNEQVLITAAAEEDVPVILTATKFSVKHAEVTRV